MSHTRDSEAPKRERLRPYEPPRIEESGDFERLVLACTHQVQECVGKNDTAKS